MGQNALCHSNCTIFKRMKSPERINVIDTFFGGMTKNSCGQSDYETLKLNVYQERKVEIN